MMTCCLLLAACVDTGGGSKAEQLALDIRGEYLALEGFTAGVEIAADYGERVYEYTVDLSYAREGESVLTVTAPETIAGVTARISGEDTALEYDGVRVETGPLDSAGMSPIDAIPALLEQVEEGFIAACGMEEGGETQLLRVICRDPESTAGEGRECSLWFDPDTHALLRGEFSQDGATVIRCEFSDFQPSAQKQE